MTEEKKNQTDETVQDMPRDCGETEDTRQAAEEPAGDPSAGSADTSEEAGAEQEPGKDPEPAQEAQPESKKEKRFWKKEKKDKNAELIEELTDRVKRQMAEFENFRKRSEKEKAGMFEMGAKSVIEQILPIVDNFERGLGALTEEARSDPFADGMQKVYRQLLELLEKMGVKPIEAVGQPFDPEFHNAVMHVEDEEAGENVVVEEFLRGYTYHDQVVRHSMVKVAN